MAERIDKRNSNEKEDSLRKRAGFLAMASLALVLIASVANGHASENQLVGDVDGNGIVNPIDAQFILQKSAGLIDRFPVELKSTFTPEPTNTPRPPSDPIPTQTTEATPKSIELIETIEVGIPGLSIERYRSPILDITSSAAEEYQQSIEDMFVEDNYSWPKFRENHLFMNVAEPSVVFSEVSRMGNIYYNGLSEKFYTNLKKGDEKISPETSLMLGFDDISADGKILYHRRLPYPRENPRITTVEYFLLDIENSTKIVIRNLRDKPLVSWSEPGDDSPQAVPDFEVKLTEDGNKLLVSFFEEPDRGSYLIDLSSKAVQPLDIDNGIVYLLVDNSLGAGTNNRLGPSRHLVSNHDGSLIFAPYNDLLTSSFDRYGAIIDTVTGEKTILPWPGRHKSKPPHIASPEFDFIAQKVQIGGPFVHSPGAWGTAVSNSEGFFLFDGLDRNVTPKRIYDSGNIFVSVGGQEVLLAFNGNSYEIMATEDGDPVEIEITKE